MNKLIAMAIVSCVVLSAVPAQAGAAAKCGAFPGIMHPEKVKVWKTSGCSYKFSIGKSLVAKK